jgi:hypothetical protein
MASTFEKTSEGTIYKPARTLNVPEIDVLTLLFGETCLHHLHWRCVPVPRRQTTYTHV